MPLIAAGSLFTSCIEPVEPAGILGLREAKARYYDALSKLRAADAEMVLAQADLEKAKAELQRAKVEEQNLLNEMQRLTNELKAAQNEKEKANLAAQIEELKKQHEINMQNLENNLLTAKWNYEQARRNIEAAAADLTAVEKAKLQEVMTAYQTAYNNYIQALKDLRDAESTRWDLENGTLYTYGGEYLNAGEYYKSRQEYYEGEADYYADLYQNLSESTFMAWYDSLSTWQLYADALKAQRQENTKDSLDYFVNVYHEGAFNFNVAVNNWFDKNKPKADPGDGPVAPEEPAADATSYENQYEYTGDDTEIVHHKGDVVTGAAQIEFEKLENTNLSAVVYNKFVYLLDSYQQDSPALPGTNIVNDAAADGYVELTADQDMKAFILGAKDAQKLSYKRTKDAAPIFANYGLWGAYYTLERELVLESEKDPKTIADYKKDWEDAQKTWTDDREILDKGLTSYKPYTDALAAYKEKKTAYDNAVKEASTESGNLAKAAETVVNRINKAVMKNEKLSYYDSTELVKTFVDFAKARKEYLAYTPYKHNEAKDSNNFYFALATDPKIRDSVEFQKITYETLLTGKDCRYNYSDTAWAANPNVAKGYAAFQRIAWQLLGPAAGSIFDEMSITNEKQITVADLNSVAFYNAYKYEDGKIKYLDGTEYVPKTVSDAKTELGKAETAVKNAAKAFVQVYNRFWAQTANTTITTAPYTLFDTYFASQKADDLKKAEKEFKIGGTLLPLNHNCYTYKTFTDPYNVVSFEDANTLVETKALCAILTAVDPAADGNREDNTFFEGNLTSSQIFYGPATDKKTDFYKMMYALYVYEKKSAKSEDLVIIKTWIESVEAAFEADVEATEKAIKEAYAIDKAEYDKKAGSYDADKEAYDNYMKALKEFVGVDENGDPTPELTTWVDYYGDYVLVARPVLDDYQMDQNTMTTDLFYHPYVGLYWKDAYTVEGIWEFNDAPLVGGLKAIAEECIPGFPEKLAELATNYFTLEDQITHYETLVDNMSDAFLAAAQAVNNYNAVSGTYFDRSDEDFYKYFYDGMDSPEAIDYTSFKKYVQGFMSWINAMYTLCCDEAVMYEHAYEKYLAGLDQEQIDIELQQERVAMYTEILAQREAELEIAKAAYDRVLAAILANQK